MRPPIGGASGQRDAEAQHAFTGGMQIASVVVGVMLVAAGIMAWKLIPSGPTAERP